MTSTGSAVPSVQEKQRFFASQEKQNPWCAITSVHEKQRFFSSQEKQNPWCATTSVREENKFVLPKGNFSSSQEEQNV
jgi:hypothetical protein